MRRELRKCKRQLRDKATDLRVLMLGLLVQPEKGLVQPNVMAELHLWSSWRLLANASSQGDNQP